MTESAGRAERADESADGAEGADESADGGLSRPTGTESADGPNATANGQRNATSIWYIRSQKVLPAH